MFVHRGDTYLVQPYLVYYQIRHHSRDGYMIVSGTCTDIKHFVADGPPPPLHELSPNEHKTN